MSEVFELRGWVVVWELDGCEFLTTYDTEEEARSFGENPKRQGTTHFVGEASDLLNRCLIARPTSAAESRGGTTEPMDAKAMKVGAGLAKLSEWLTRTSGVDRYYEIRDLLADAGLELLRAAHLARTVGAAIEEVRTVAVAIQASSSPTSVIAADLYERLQEVESDLMPWVEEPALTGRREATEE